MQLIAKAVLWLHVSLYQLTNGRIGGRFIAGSPILLLTTIGRRTGKRRTRPLAYVRDGERYVLCASNGGSPAHPGWYHNLCHRSGRDPGQSRAPCCRRQDRRSHRAQPAVRSLCGDVQGLRRLRAQDQPPDPAGAADPRPTERNLLKAGGRDLCRVKSRTADSARLVTGVSPGQSRNFASRGGPLVAAVVRWSMPQLCPTRLPSLAYSP